MIEQFV